MEKATLLVKELYITQEMNGSYSHNGELAIDISSKCEFFASPFSGTIKRIYEKCNAVWLESDEKVIYADGSIDYMTIMLIHDDDITNLKVGMKIKKGDKTFYQPGNKGLSSGSHIHIGVGKGKFYGNGWFRGEYQPKTKSYAYPIRGQYPINKALFIDSSVKKTRPFYDWKTLPEEKSKINYFKKCDEKFKSLIDALKSIGENSDFEYRKKVALKNGLSDFHGKSNENIKLLKLLKSGKLIKP